MSKGGGMNRINGGMERMERMDALDRRVADALERVPAVNVPADFAARVASKVPARRTVAVASSSYGLLAARMGIAVLLIAIVFVAMGGSGRTVFGITLEWILCGELAGLSIWMGSVWGLSQSEA